MEQELKNIINNPKSVLKDSNTIKFKDRIKKPISKNAFKTASCGIYFLVIVLFIIIQLSKYLCFNEMMYKGQYIKTNCTIIDNEEKVESGSLIIKYNNGIEVNKYWISASVALKNITSNETTTFIHKFKKKLISLDLFNELFSSTDSSEGLIDTMFTLNTSKIIIESNLKCKKNIYCYYREFDSNKSLYLEKTNIFEACIYIFNALIIVDIIIFLILIIILIKNCVKRKFYSRTDEEDFIENLNLQYVNIKKQKSESMVLKYMCCLSRGIVFCGINERNNKNRFVPVRLESV